MRVSCVQTPYSHLLIFAFAHLTISIGVCYGTRASVHFLCVSRQTRCEHDDKIAIHDIICIVEQMKKRQSGNEANEKVGDKNEREEKYIRWRDLAYEYLQMIIKDQ